MNNFECYNEIEVFKSQELVQSYFHDETYYLTPLHTHNFYEMNIVMSGNGVHHVNNSSYFITAGDIFIMPPGIPHGYTFDSKNYSIFHLLFNKHFFKKYKSALNNLTGYQILFNIDPLIRNEKKIVNNFLHVNITENYNLIRVFNELSFLEKQEKGNVEHEKEHLALYVIGKICDIIEEEKTAYNGQHRYLFDLLKSVEYIHANYGEKIELRTLYTISCMSRSTYVRYFKSLFNCPPLDYILNYRLRQAKSILKHSDDSISSIAASCGFCDSAHFSRMFKEKYHMTPLKYRNTTKKAENPSLSQDNQTT